MTGLKRLKQFIRFTGLQRINCICLMFNIFQLWSVANAETPCKHTFPDVNGWFLVPLNDSHYCGCNEGEFMEDVGKWQNSTICVRCPFDPSNPAKQTYMAEGPHLNRECKPAVVNCVDGKVRVMGNRCFPAQCVSSEWVDGYRVPECSCGGVDQSGKDNLNDSGPSFLWVAVLILGVLLVFSVLMNIYQKCKRSRRRATENGVTPDGATRLEDIRLSCEEGPDRSRPQSDENAESSFEQQEPGNDVESSPQPQLPVLSRRQSVPEEDVHSNGLSENTNDPLLPQNDSQQINTQTPSSPVTRVHDSTPPPLKAVANTNEADGVGGRSLPVNSKPGECSSNRRNEKDIIRDIKFGLGKVMDVHDSKTFFRMFGAQTDDLNFCETYRDNQLDWFIRLFEICEKSSFGRKICPEDLEKYFEELNKPDPLEVVRKAIAQDQQS